MSPHREKKAFTKGKQLGARNDNLTPTELRAFLCRFNLLSSGLENPQNVSSNKTLESIYCLAQTVILVKCFHIPSQTLSRQQTSNN